MFLIFYFEIYIVLFFVVVWKSKNSARRKKVHCILYFFQICGHIFGIFFTVQYT